VAKNDRADYMSPIELMAVFNILEENETLKISVVLEY